MDKITTERISALLKQTLPHLHLSLSIIINDMMNDGYDYEDVKDFIFLTTCNLIDKDAEENQ
jgi:hypothetical protein